MTKINDDAFSYCTGITSVTINCANVDSWFRGIESIEELTFGENVTNIYDGAFYGCTGLRSVTSYIMAPFSINSNVFSVYETATLNVPCRMKEKYEFIPSWNQFQNIKEMPYKPKGDVNSDYSVDVADIASIISNMTSNSDVLSASADVNILHFYLRRIRRKSLHLRWRDALHAVPGRLDGWGNSDNCR